MQFIRTIKQEEATGELKEFYERALARGGQLPVLEAWSLRHDVLEAWQALTRAIVSHMDERRYQLVALIAASRVRCSVCTLQLGSQLESKHFSAEQVRAITCENDTSGLEPVDQAIAAYAEKVALHAHEITEDDVEGLRSFGLDDAEIFDIALAASLRTAWGKANDAIGYEPSLPFLERTSSQFGEEMFRALMVGRKYEVPARAPVDR